MQGDGASHHDTGNEKAQFAVTLCIVLIQMVTVDQFVQIVGSLGVTGIDMRNFRIGFPVAAAICRMPE